MKYLVGDAREVLATLPESSVDLVVTSPPFLALRDYLPANHPDKALEMGSERSPGEFLDALLDVIEGCARVLAPHGSICIELGDTYAGSGGAGGDYNGAGLRAGQATFSGSAAKRAQNGVGDEYRPARNGTNRTGRWPLDKSLALIPEITRFALAYGFNPLTGRKTDAWRVRNVIRWCRPNPPVGALADKVRPATSDILVACKGRKRYFDLDAVRTPSSGYERGPAARATANGQRPKACLDTVNAAGAPPLDHWWYDEDDAFPQDAWKVSTVPYKGAHYATYPPKLILPIVESMCPREVCLKCGKPRERMVSIDHTPNRNTNGPQSIERKHLNGGSAGYTVRADRRAETTGWSDCGCKAGFRPGLVLDPFGGTGVTGAVASGCGRDAILIDLDERNLELARERVGMFLEVPA